MQLIVLGMHRSGTSGVTRLLNLAGAWFGPPGSATEPNDENPKGFWERRDVRAVCDGLLRGGGFDWYRLGGFSLDAIPQEVIEEQRSAFAEILAELDAHRPWVVKEPRLCLLLPILAPQLSSPVCVHVSREPLEVAHSVHVRNGLSVPGSLALWELYSRHALAASAGLPAVQVRHQDVIADPVGTLSQLIGDLQAVGVQGLMAPPDDEVLDFITPKLHRQHQASDDRGQRLNAEQAALAQAIEDGSALGASPGQPTASVMPTRWASTGSLSAGAADELVVLDRIDDLERAVTAANRTVHGLERQVTHERNRRHSVAGTAIEALDRAESDVKAMGHSKPAQLAAYLVAIRRTLTPGQSRSDPTPFSRALAGIDLGRRQVRGRSRDQSTPQPVPAFGTEQTPNADAVPSASAATDKPTPTNTSQLITRTRPATRPTGRPKVAVLAWDVGHNPLGRANVLAEVLARRFDVEMWGAQFERYGSRVWAPLRDTAIPVNVFPGRPFPDHFAVMEHVAERIDADAVWVSKPRLPSLLLGALAKEHRNRPLVVDVDDHELAFFGTDEGLDLASVVSRFGDPGLVLPFEEAWTRATDRFIGSGDAVTVSNLALEQRYGGIVVPHARDENLFDPDRFDRQQVRRRLGIAPDQRIVLFGGTPRAHKGVVELLEALDEIGDDRNRVMMFGTRELEDLKGQIGKLDRWALALPYQPFRELPAVVMAADVACVLQDPSHPVSRYQMPAKVTDALAMGVPLLVRPTPPMQPLVDAGVVSVHEHGTSLARSISDLLDHPDEAQERATRGRKLFLGDLSYAAVADRVVPLFESLIAEPPALSSALLEFIDGPRALYSGRGSTDSVVSTATPRRDPSQRRSITPGQTFDVVMFWKQNDSGIYGRRQDMFLDQLNRSPRVGTVVHFDNPITPEQLVQTWRTADGPADQGRLVVRQTLGRLRDRPAKGGVHRHTFLYAGSRSRRFGLRRRDKYADWVQEILAAHNIGQRPWVLWAYPTNTDLPGLIDRLDPDVVLADVVDDNRTWFSPGTPEHDRADLNYEQVLDRADIVVANCEPVAASMSTFASSVEVVPNGLELRRPGPPGPRPAELARLAGPIIGYVGNLSSRIDLQLLAGLVEARPQWQFVFIGSAHLDGAVLDLDRHANVHFLGVKPHREVGAYLDHFDVALIPHLDNEMTRAMNPLKAFTYCAAGVPVVSTPIANLGDLAQLISITTGVDGFIEAIEAHLAAGRQPVDVDRLARHSWEERLAQVMALIDGLDSPLQSASPPEGEDLPG